MLETPTCGHCGHALDRLGGSRQSTGAEPPVEIVHYQCPACGRRWLEHSGKGWRETDRELDD